jgi:hypothetical protein
VYRVVRTYPDFVFLTLLVSDEVESSRLQYTRIASTGSKEHSVNRRTSVYELLRLERTRGFHL